MLKHLVQNIKTNLVEALVSFCSEFLSYKILGAYGDSGAICTNGTLCKTKLT